MDGRSAVGGGLRRERRRTAEILEVRVARQLRCRQHTGNQCIPVQQCFPGGHRHISAVLQHRVRLCRQQSGCERSVHHQYQLHRNRHARGPSTRSSGCDRRLRGCDAEVAVGLSAVCVFHFFGQRQYAAHRSVRCAGSGRGHIVGRSGWTHRSAAEPEHSAAVVHCPGSLTRRTHVLSRVPTVAIERDQSLIERRWRSAMDRRLVSIQPEVGSTARHSRGVRSGNAESDRCAGQPEWRVPRGGWPSGNRLLRRLRSDRLVVCRRMDLHTRAALYRR